MVPVMVRNTVFLVLGIMLGVRLTDIIGYLKLWRESDLRASEKAALLKYPVASEEVLATWLDREVRILCLVLTMPSSHSTKAARVNRTWGARCNKLIFLSSQTDPNLSILKMDIPETRGNLYAKVRTGMAYAHKHYLNDFDWFLKADDDTYIVMENLRLFLYPYDPESSVFFGCRFKSGYSQGYMSGGAGYVLSRDALRRLNLFALNSTTTCKLNEFAEDLQIGHCLQDVGVIAGDTRDFQGRHRFLPISPYELMPFIELQSWTNGYFFHKPNRSDCCSASAISFHYVKDVEFEFLEFFLYHLRVFGLHQAQRALPSRLGFRQMNERLQHWSRQVTDNRG
ncbi:glycoprotein-N-acetylgalactosamine 3-beta-galactosyltransferase 1 [Drosophila eugracilis]|uniref:glycoprotein-N-acetylgalactosamine 3-beta-galactosyltransferase 1 n=1 Tax=Drosophila eugracilis TaxID=29029 RepID=UPI0007E861EB|nr:glycoprotein-N-acetylgalactosamine 3-beta-galactosyltransferase 1 [Drosophila eugracilis]